MTQVRKTFDTLLEMKDAGLVPASAAATVDGSAKVLDLGLGNVDADLIIEVSACEVASGDEMYTIGFQISSSATFASDIYEVASIKLGDASPLPGDVDMGAGRYVLGVNNRIANGTNKQY